MTSSLGFPGDTVTKRFSAAVVTSSGSGILSKLRSMGWSPSSYEYGFGCLPNTRDLRGLTAGCLERSSTVEFSSGCDLPAYCGGNAHDEILASNVDDRAAGKLVGNRPALNGDCVSVNGRWRYMPSSCCDRRNGIGNRSRCMPGCGNKNGGIRWTSKLSAAR